MYGPSGRAQSWSTFNHRQPTPVASSSPAPYLYPIVRPSRSSSVTVPSPKSGPRFRTAVRPERHDDRELRQKLSKSRLRLLSSFDAIADKYGSVPPEEDDEIDLFECDITKDNGHLESLEPRLFADGNDYVGEAIEDEDGIRLDLLRQQSEPVRGPEQIEFGDDEDELGDWGNKSGLDAQYPVVEIENDWTADDLNDLDEFMRAEAARRARYGEESLPVFERPSVASSPLRNLRHLVLDASPEVEEAVMDESELPKGSRVSSGGREAVSRHPERTLTISSFLVAHQLHHPSHTSAERVQPRGVDPVLVTPTSSSSRVPRPRGAIIFLGNFRERSTASRAARPVTLSSTRRLRPASSPYKAKPRPPAQGRTESAFYLRRHCGSVTAKHSSPCDDLPHAPLHFPAAAGLPRHGVSRK